MKIEIAGPGCPKCITTANNVKKALSQLGQEAEVKHIFDIKEFVKRGIVFTPAVIIDGEIISSGKVLTVDELKEIISKR